MSEHNPKRCQRCLIARVEELEAQVQAVRDACDNFEPDGLRSGDWWVGYYTARDRVRRALDGGAE